MKLSLWRCDDGTYDVLDTSCEHGDEDPAIVAQNVPAKVIVYGQELLEALQHISLCSQNSASIKEECGRIARAALSKVGK